MLAKAVEKETGATSGNLVDTVAAISRNKKQSVLRESRPWFSGSGFCRGSRRLIDYRRVSLTIARCPVEEAAAIVITVVGQKMHTGSNRSPSFVRRASRYVLRTSLMLPPRANNP